MTFQAEKNLVRTYLDAVVNAPPTACAEAMAPHVASEFTWRGYHPFNELQGASAVANRFWAPLKSSLSRLQRRQDIFFAGKNEIDGFSSTWVVSMGHLVGLFDAAWLGIRPTGKMAFLRYCAFHQVENGRITKETLFFDIPHLAAQAGQPLFGPQTAQHLVQPGPMTHDGLLYEGQDQATGEATLALINAMISDLGQWQLGLPLEEELARTWADDMIWWGPEGVGATYTIERYAKQHSGPFRAAFADRAATGHLARLAEGNYGGFFGWPNFTARHVGGFMGMPACDGLGEFRVIDIYRREGGKLAENWIFIDLLHFWKCLGVDILERFAGINGS